MFGGHCIGKILILLSFDRGGLGLPLIGIQRKDPECVSFLLLFAKGSGFADREEFWTVWKESLYERFHSHSCQMEVRRHSHCIPYFTRLSFEQPKVLFFLRVTFVVGIQMYKPTVTCSMNQTKIAYHLWQNKALEKYTLICQPQLATKHAFFTHLCILCQWSTGKMSQRRPLDVECNVTRCNAKVLNLLNSLVVIRGPSLYEFSCQNDIILSTIKHKGIKLNDFYYWTLQVSQISFCRLFKVFLWENYPMEHYMRHFVCFCTTNEEFSWEIPPLNLHFCEEVFFPLLSGSWDLLAFFLALASRERVKTMVTQNVNSIFLTRQPSADVHAL